METGMDDLFDYEDDETSIQTGTDNVETNDKSVDMRGNYVSVHSSAFRDFLLKPEILKAISDCGFEHPSEGILQTCINRRGMFGMLC